ncbi:MAG: dTDP-4-dehydrorhamnose 3,5-epimerase family protein [Candidatus Omnitrophota bacterium]
MIDGLKVKPLKIIPDDRGNLMEIFRADDCMFSQFGQVYFTTAYPGVVKAWHYHKLQDDNFTCVVGRIKLGLYDARENSPTKGQTDIFYLSLKEPKLVHIPKGVYHGFKCVSQEEAMVINTVTRPYDHKNPDEYRVDASDPTINFNWKED